MTLHEWHPGRLWFTDINTTQLGLSRIHRMVILRLTDNSLLIHNPIELTSSLKTWLEKIGTVQAVVCASPTYHTYLSDWWLTYPDALFYATPTLIQSRTDLHFDDALSGYSPLLWKNNLYQTPLLGFEQPRKIIFCDPKSRTLILSDHLLAIQSHMPKGQKLLTWASGANKDLKLSPIDRFHLTNMPALRSSVQEIMTWPFDRLISTTGLHIDKEAKKSIYRAFWWAF